jgi:DNA repair exonuclease SbcCD ATPase subunit
MIKKMFLFVAIVVAAFATLKGTKFFGLAKHEIDEAKAWIDSQIPVEKEIQRLRKEVAALEKDRKKVGDLLAKEIVEVRYLRENTEELRIAVANEEDRLHAKAEEIKNANTKVKYGYGLVSVEEAKAMLKADVARHLARKATLEAQEKTLAAREQNKENLSKQLDVLHRQKEGLAVEIDTLEAEWKVIQLQQMESKYQTDNTRLAKVKEGLRDLRKKLEIEREKLNLAPRVMEENLPTSSGSVSGQTVDEIMAPLNGKPAPAGELSKN